jgi:hypothetical protein
MTASAVPAAGRGGPAPPRDAALKLLSVLVPSRTQPLQSAFLKRALGSIAAQRARSTLAIEVVVGLDPAAEPPALDGTELPVRFVKAARASQAAALNAAAAAAGGDAIAMLEDDDAWQSEHVATALEHLAAGAFVSGTQLEITPQGEVIRINDFPTPSGWLMPRAVWDAVGPFDEEYRYHLDNDWLGRLGSSGTRRVHLVEATAPTVLEVAMQVRPWLAKVLTLGGGSVRLHRHAAPVPLVLRTLHAGSGMQQIAREPAAAQVSKSEYGRLMARFGRVPW